MRGRGEVTDMAVIISLPLSLHLSRLLTVLSLIPMLALSFMSPSSQPCWRVPSKPGTSPRSLDLCCAPHYEGGP